MAENPGQAKVRCTETFPEELARLHKTTRRIIMNTRLRGPLKPADAKALLRTILETGRVDVSSHAWVEMQTDRITIQDIFRVLRGGVVEPAEFRGGSWRYRVRHGRHYVVVSFRSESWTVVVTVWRTR